MLFLMYIIDIFLVDRGFHVCKFIQHHFIVCLSLKALQFTRRCTCKTHRITATCAKELVIIIYYNKTSL